jgi:hypothetical protein
LVVLATRTALASLLRRFCLRDFPVEKLLERPAAQEKDLFGSLENAPSGQARSQLHESPAKRGIQPGRLIVLDVVERGVGAAEPDELCRKESQVLRDQAGEPLLGPLLCLSKVGRARRGVGQARLLEQQPNVLEHDPGLSGPRGVERVEIHFAVAVVLEKPRELGLEGGEAGEPLLLPYRTTVGLPQEPLERRISSG